MGVASSGFLQLAMVQNGQISISTHGTLRAKAWLVITGPGHGYNDGTFSHSGGEVTTGGSTIDIPFSTSQKANRIGGSSPREAIATSSLHSMIIA